MQVEQIDIDAVNAFQARSFEALFRSTGPAKRPINEAHRLLAEAFARHRRQARAEVVGEIVVELRGLHWTHRDAEPAKRIADLIEAKFGADNGQRHEY